MFAIAVLCVSWDRQGLAVVLQSGGRRRETAAIRESGDHVSARAQSHPPSTPDTAPAGEEGGLGGPSLREEALETDPSQ